MSRIDQNREDYGRISLDIATPTAGTNQADTISELLKWYEAELLIDWKPVPREPMMEKIKHLINVTVQLNRIELAKDIKRRHWVNEKLRDAYLDAVISVANERLAVKASEEYKAEQDAMEKADWDTDNL